MDSSDDQRAELLAELDKVTHRVTELELHLFGGESLPSELLAELTRLRAERTSLMRRAGIRESVVRGVSIAGQGGTTTQSDEGPSPLN